MLGEEGLELGLLKSESLITSSLAGSCVAECRGWCGWPRPGLHSGRMGHTNSHQRNTVETFIVMW